MANLLTASLEDLLLDLATQQATGCLTVVDPDGEEAQVWMRDGYIYSVSVPGRRALLGARLLSSGNLAPEALGEALEIQRTELQGWRLGELLIHLGYVEREVIEDFTSEQLRDMLDDLLTWEVATTKFKNGKRTRQDVSSPCRVPTLLTELRERHKRWAHVLDVIGSEDAVPLLATTNTGAADVELGPHDWSVLCKVDGERSVTDLADDCGFSLLETGEMLLSLISSGLVDIDGPGMDEGRPDSRALDLPDNVTDLATVRAANAEDPTDEEVAASVASVAAALKDMHSGITWNKSKSNESGATTDLSVDLVDEEPTEVVAFTDDADADDAEPTMPM